MLCARRNGIARRNDTAYFSFSVTEPAERIEKAEVAPLVVGRFHHACTSYRPVSVLIVSIARRKYTYTAENLRGGLQTS